MWKTFYLPQTAPCTRRNLGINMGLERRSPWGEVSRGLFKLTNSRGNQRPNGAWHTLRWHTLEFCSSLREFLFESRRKLFVFDWQILCTVLLGQWPQWRKFLFKLSGTRSAFFQNWFPFLNTKRPSDAFSSVPVYQEKRNSNTQATSYFSKVFSKWIHYIFFPPSWSKKQRRERNQIHADKKEIANLCCSRPESSCAFLCFQQLGFGTVLRLFSGCANGISLEAWLGCTGTLYVGVFCGVIKFLHGRSGVLSW